MFWTGIGLTLLTGLLWSAVGIVYSRAAEKAQGACTFFFISACCFALTSWGVTMPAAAPAEEVGRIALLMIPAGVAGQLGFLALREAMRRGSHGIGWCMAQAAMLCPFVVGILCWHEAASAWRLAGMAGLIGSLVLLGGAGDRTAGAATRGNFLFYAFLAFLLLGLQQTLTLVPSRLPAVSEAALSWRVPLFSLCGLGWGVGIWLRRERAWRAMLPLAVLYGVVVAAGQWTLFRAIDSLNAVNASGIAYPLAVGSSIALFFLYARTVRHERNGFAGLIGIILAIAGILLLAF